MAQGCRDNNAWTVIPGCRPEYMGSKHLPTWEVSFCPRVSTPGDTPIGSASSCPQEWEGRGPLDPGSLTRVLGNGKQFPRGACRGWACRDGTPPLSCLYSEAGIPCRYPTARAVIPIRASAGRLTAQGANYACCLRLPVHFICLSISRHLLSDSESGEGDGAATDNIRPAFPAH